MNELKSFKATAAGDLSFKHPRPPRPPDTLSSSKGDDLRERDAPPSQNSQYTSPLEGQCHDDSVHLDHEH